MSIPGLQLAAPVESAAPAEHELEAGSEWRFEVGYGETIRVKVCVVHLLSNACFQFLKLTTSLM
jgi:hypothetical protein